MASPINYLSQDEQVLFPRARKRFGFSQLFGTAFFGYMRFGEFNPYAGIFRHTQYYNNRVWQKIKFYWPKNPRTVPQQANRSKMADGVLAWRELSPEQVKDFNKRAKRKQMSGYNLFLSEYLYSH